MARTVRAASGRRPLTAAALALMMAPVALSLHADAIAGPREYSVVIEGTSFQPDSLRVSPGDTVIWTNKDPFPHTVTAPSGAFKSGSIAPGATWKYMVQQTKGTFPYICTLHQTMKGALVVR